MHVFQRLFASLLTGAALLAPAGVARAAEPVTPPCAWATQSHPPEANAAFPDTNATYWLMSYTVQPGLQIKLDGTYPDARYTSLTTYDSERNLFSVNGVDSGISDYEIAPNAGSVNPWQEAGPAGGKYAVTLKQDVSAGEKNVLPLAPDGASAGQTGYLIMRVYLPTDDYTKVTLPTVTFTLDGNSVTLPNCTHENQAAGPAATGVSLPAAVTQRVDFARAFASDLSGFPSSANGYLAAVVSPPAADQVIVMRGKAPTTPNGPHPAPWPSASAQVRYWSMCTNVAVLPYPVVINGTDPGCRADDVTKLDKDGYYTYVVGTEAQRAQIETIPGVTFLPFSADQPNARHVLLLRNMLGDAFAHSVQAVTDRTAATAKRIMAEYYPEAAVCSLPTAATCLT
jgi:hypothetical protein